MITFNIKYFFITILLLITEVLIGLYVDDSFIRPHGGDFLVVVLVYCFVKAFVDAPVVYTTICVLLFAYLIELSQYLNLVNLLGWEHNNIATLLMGTTFSVIDWLMYTLGGMFIILIEKVITRKRIASNTVI